MSTFKSSEKIIAAPRSVVYARLSDLESFRSLADNIPESAQAQIGNIKIEGETITLNAKPIGDISFQVTKRVENESIRLETVTSPLPFCITVCLADDSETTTKAHVEIAIELNPIIKPMLSKPIQEAAEKFAELVATIPYKS